MLRNLAKALFVAVAALPVSAPSTAAPADPTGRWNLEYSPTSCDAKRRFGDTAIVFSPSPLGNTTRLLIELPGRAIGARQYAARINPLDGKGTINHTALLFPLKSKPGFRGIYAVLPSDLVDRMFASGRLDMSVGSDNDLTKTSYKSAHADLQLGPTAKLRSSLDTCMADLRKSWGMIDGKLPTPAIASGAIGDVRSVFRADDYPDDALDKGQSGTTRFLLMVDEGGRVLDCMTIQSSGIASLDAMGCQVIRERARFRPARDSSGKPVKDTYVTPPVRWALSG